MVDIMCGPNYPLAKGFEMAGWCILVVDWWFGEEHDLSRSDNQVTIGRQLKRAGFIWAVLDCSDESRIKEIQRKHADGGVMPPPLRSEGFPVGLPGLQSHDKEEVTAGNAAAEFILGELRLHQSRGGTSGRGNPANSLHLHTPTEASMFKQGTWWDKRYDACTLQGVRMRKRCIRTSTDEEAVHIVNWLASTDIRSLLQAQGLKRELVRQDRQERCPRQLGTEQGFCSKRVENGS